MEVLIMSKYCIRISESILLLLIVYEPPFVAISFNNLMLFISNQVWFGISRILIFTFICNLILSVALLKDRMIDLWLTHVHHSSGRTCFFVIRFVGSSIGFEIIVNAFKGFSALVLWWLWRWFQHRCLVLIRILKGVTHNALLSWCFRDFGDRSLTFVQTLPTIFSMTYFWRFPL